MTAAHDILTKAAGHMQDRASTYDKPEGERSMAQTVAIFNLYHGTDLTEAQGWHLLQILKDVRLFARPGYHADSAEDCVAYAALKAEALKGAAMAAIDPALLGVCGVHELVDCLDEARRQDAEAEGEAFAAIEEQQCIDSGPMWMEWDGGHQPVLNDVVVEVVQRGGARLRGTAENFSWRHFGAGGDIVRWREPWLESQPYTGQGGVMIRCPGCVALSCECRP